MPIQLSFWLRARLFCIFKVIGIRTSGGEIIGILKKIKDADPADSHHVSEWKECQKSRMEGLRSRLLLWRSSPQWMRDDLENIYMKSNMYVGNGTQLALCNVGWLTAREFVFLVPGPIVFAPLSVLFGRGEPCVTAVKTRHALWCCVSLVPRPTTSLPEWRTRRDKHVRLPSTGCSRRWSGRTARRTEPRNTRPTTTPSSCGATTMAGPRGALHGSHNTVVP